MDASRVPKDHISGMSTYFLPFATAVVEPLQLGFSVVV